MLLNNDTIFTEYFIFDIVAVESFSDCSFGDLSFEDIAGSKEDLEMSG